METNKLTDSELAALKAAIADHYKNEAKDKELITAEDIKAWAAGKTEPANFQQPEISKADIEAWAKNEKTTK